MFFFFAVTYFKQNNPNFKVNLINELDRSNR